jgi:hypothetical protein
MQKNGGRKEKERWGGGDYATLTSGVKKHKGEEMGSVVRPSSLQSQGLHHFARFRNKPRVEREESGGGDGDGVNLIFEKQRVGRRDGAWWC